MRTIGWAMVLVGCSRGADEAAGPDPRLDPETWPETVGPADRPARVIPPDAYSAPDRLPVIVLLHGYGASALVQDVYLGVSTRVPPLGGLLVLPEGTVDPDGSQFWNATADCCDFYGSGVDDVGYLLGVLDAVEEAFPVDPERIAFLGHSNGGYMSYRMACEASERIDAIATLAGAPLEDAADCAATAPTHVLHTHGTVDDSVFYEGSPGQPGALETVERWAALAGCDPEAPRAGTPRDYVVDVEGAETAVTTWPEGCRDTAVELWTLEGAGHLPAIANSYRDDLVGWLLDPPR